MKNIATETLMAIELFELQNNKKVLPTRKNVILHIPHSSTKIPDYSFYVVSNETLNSELELLTDHFTDEIFNLKNVDKIITPFSRLFCDVERFADDDDEIMSKFGRGFYYTKTDSGEDLRSLNSEFKNNIYLNYYLKHHLEFEKIIDEKLNKFDNVIIIDCHSFPNKPLKTDLLKTTGDRPDICLGIDEFHSSKLLIQNLKMNFESNGLKVEINDPYRGTIIPLKYYRKNFNVLSIMIEVNRNLYIDESNVINKEKVKILNNIIDKSILF